MIKFIMCLLKMFNFIFFECIQSVRDLLFNIRAELVNSSDH